MVLDRLDQYIDSIKKDEEIKFKGLSILEIAELLSCMECEGRAEILSKLDEETIDKLEKMKEGGLI